MAFCNSCGANIAAGAKFCPKCGAEFKGGVPAPAAAVPAQSGGALKIILIAGGAILVLVIVGIMGTAFLAWRVARASHVQSRDGNVRVETPFGTVESTNNPGQAARNLGVDLYPGARALQVNSANVAIGGMHTVAAEFETSDPPSKVADFYRKRYPDANVNVSDQDHYTIVSTKNKDVVTINIEREGDSTHIHIAAVRGNPISGSDASN